MSNPEFRVKAGKRYVRRDGSVSGFINDRGSTLHYRFTDDEGNTYDAEGWYYRPNEPSGNDLIAEYTDHQAASQQPVMDAIGSVSSLDCSRAGHLVYPVMMSQQAGRISEGRACELLGLNRIEYRERMETAIEAIEKLCGDLPSGVAVLLECLTTKGNSNEGVAEKELAEHSDDAAGQSFGSGCNGGCCSG